VTLLQPKAQSTPLANPQQLSKASGSSWAAYAGSNSVVADVRMMTVGLLTSKAHRSSTSGFDPNFPAAPILEHTPATAAGGIPISHPDT